MIIIIIIIIIITIIIITIIKKWPALAHTVIGLGS